MCRRASRTLLALVLLVLAAACQDPDVGQSCTLSWGSDAAAPPPTASTALADYFESGNIACDGLICLVSPVAPGSDYDGAAGIGYCSKACVSDDDCYQDETGLVCRQMVLDPFFLEQLDAETRARYLADVQYSSYCAVPR
jgi:hypothetical protein